MAITLFVASVIAQCPTTTPSPPGPPNCANYSPGYFVNDPTDCQAYFYCADAVSPPYPGRCEVPYNFDQSNQLCNHPNNYPCPAECKDDGSEFTKVSLKRPCLPTYPFLLLIFKMNFRLCRRSRS